MNYLAHIYLSGNHDFISIGNFIADSIKGKKYLSYPQEIINGILLHREIDSFTDTHPIVRTSKKRLHKRYRHYDGVIIDILYDHFLAKNWDSYCEVPLDIYVQNFYNLLTTNIEILPEKVQKFMPYMIEGNWIYNYKKIEGIERVLQGMDKRTDNKSQMRFAIEDLQLYYSDFENDFTAFFENLRIFCDTKLTTITHE